MVAAGFCCMKRPWATLLPKVGCQAIKFKPGISSYLPENPLVVVCSPNWRGA